MKTTVLTILLLTALPPGAARAWTPAPSSPDSTASLPDKLDLNAAIHYALDHNYSILQAREQIRQQEGAIVQVKAQQIPNVTGTGGYQHNAAAVSQYIPETSLWTVEVKATQAIFAGGGIDASVRGAKLTRDAALYELQGAINAALLDVRTKFYGVLLAGEQVRVHEENVKLLERQLQDARNQFHAGSVSNFEVLRAEVALANAQPDLITARNNYRIGIEQLRQSLGVPSGSIGAAASFPAVVGTLDPVVEKYDLESALSSARENRPELLAIGKQQDAGEQSVRAAKSNYYPNLSAFGAYEWGGVNAVATSTLAPGTYNANGWLVGLQSSWAIFDGRATAGKVQQAKSQLNQTRLSYSSEELAIDVEVRQAFSSLQEAAELVDASQKTVEQAAEALRLATERYHAGSATQLDELTSQVALTQARTNQLQANYNYLVADAAMRKAIGLGDAQVGN